jgi:hypothetical protein
MCNTAGTLFFCATSIGLLKVYKAKKANMLIGQTTIMG